MKISALNEKQVRLFFPKQFGQILRLDLTMIGKPIGNEQHIFKFNVDLHHSVVYSLIQTLRNSHLLVISLYPFASCAV